jgi:hypothetical protein
LLGHGSYLLLLFLVQTSRCGRWRVEEVEDEAGRLPAVSCGWHAEVCGISRAAEQREGKGTEQLAVLLGLNIVASNFGENLSEVSTAGEIARG